MILICRCKFWKNHNSSKVLNRLSWRWLFFTLKMTTYNFTNVPKITFWTTKTTQEQQSATTENRWYHERETAPMEPRRRGRRRCTAKNRKNSYSHKALEESLYWRLFQKTSFFAVSKNLPKETNTGAVRERAVFGETHTTFSVQFFKYGFMLKITR